VVAHTYTSMSEDSFFKVDDAALFFPSTAVSNVGESEISDLLRHTRK
jgi:hypothetical protein